MSDIPVEEMSDHDLAKSLIEDSGGIDGFCRARALIGQPDAERIYAEFVARDMGTSTDDERVHQRVLETRT